MLVIASDLYNYFQNTSSSRAFFDAAKMMAKIRAGVIKKSFTKSFYMGRELLLWAAPAHERPFELIYLQPALKQRPLLPYGYWLLDIVLPVWQE